MQAAIILALSVGSIQMRHFLIETKPAAAVDDAVRGFAGVFGADTDTDYYADIDYYDYDNSNNGYHGTHY